MKAKIFIVVGGTGGHIYPGIALAQELKKRSSDFEPVFVTDGRPLAGKIIGSGNYGMRKISSSPFPRRKFWNICCFLFKTFIGFCESVFLIKKAKPSAVVAFGAYISVPVVLACALMKVPVILHEQNYYPGMANRFLSFCSEKVALTFKESARYFPPEKTVITGNPVREKILTVSPGHGLSKFGLDKGRATILVFGGSQGAQEINHAVCGVLPYLEGIKKRIQFLHICGNRDTRPIENKYRASGIKARVYKYIEDMHYAYSCADVIICRAGATTISEVVAKAIPAIFIPYSYAASGHQALNLKPLADKGACLVIESGALSEESLAIKLVPLIKKAGKRNQIKKNLEEMSAHFSNAASKLCDLLEEYV